MIFVLSSASSAMVSRSGLRLKAPHPRRRAGTRNPPVTRRRRQGYQPVAVDPAATGRCPICRGYGGGDTAGPCGPDRPRLVGQKGPSLLDVSVDLCDQRFEAVELEGLAQPGDEVEGH